MKEDHPNTLTHGDLAPHVLPVATYLKVFLTLAVLMVVTIGAAKIDLGYFNTPIAMIIALVKAALIVTIFMNIRYAAPLVRIFAMGGFLWLIILFGLTFSDLLTRY